MTKPWRDILWHVLRGFRAALAGLRLWRPRGSAIRYAPARQVRPPSTSGRCASVVIPTLNEAQRIADVVRYALRDPATAEVIVIDDGSIDATAALAREAGARVLTSSMLGKGASMADGVQAARHDLLVYFDGDLAGLRPGIVTALVAPLLRDEADFVKARFGRGGGRVTELTAKPMLKIFFPELDQFAQPLGGLIAARLVLLRTLEFEDGYGVDVGLLLDAHRAGARLAEVEIGSLEHDSQPLADLTLMANEVGRAIFDRARSAGRLHVDQVAAMFELQRMAAADIQFVLARRRGRRRLLLLDMDGVVTREPFALELARATGLEAVWRDATLMPCASEFERSERVARVFRYVHQKTFERVARTIELRDGVVEFVNGVRRRGFMVGVVSDGFFVAVDIVRRRVFADFALAHLLQFEREVCTGLLRGNSAFLPPQHGSKPTVEKRQIWSHFRGDAAAPLETAWAVVGAADANAAYAAAADRAFAFDGAPAWVTRIAGFDELLTLLPDLFDACPASHRPTRALKA